MDPYQLDQALRAGRLFEQLDEPVLSALRGELEPVLVRGGEVVVREGEPSDALYVVIQGRLRVVAEGGNGEATTLHELRRGQSVGEIGILTGGVRTATVYAVRDSLLARLSREGFDRLLAAHPQAMVRQFAAPVIRVLQDRTLHARQASKEVATIAIVPVDSRVGVSAFAAQLAAALGAHGSTLHLNSRTPTEDPASVGIVRWLSEQEASHRYILYEADSTATQWTERCLRQADRIVLVGEAGGRPERGEIERALLPDEGAPALAQRCLVLLHPPDTTYPSGTAPWLEARRLDAHYHVRRDDRADLARLARLLIGRGVGLVLSGGGAAGFGHIGAIRALREAGIPIDRIGGTSAGGFVACQFALGWDDATVMAKNRVAIAHKFDYTFPITALMAGGEMTAVTREMFGDAQLEDTWLPCFCVSTNLSRAEMVVHERGPIWKYTRATTSIPGLVPPVIDGGDMLVDGGLLNHLPTDVMRQRGDCAVVFACDAAAAATPTRTRHAPPYETSLSGWKVLWRRLSPFGAPMKVPTIGQILMRVAIFNAAQRIESARGLADFYLRLDLRKYGLLEFGKLEGIAAAGYESARSAVATWREDDRFRAVSTFSGQHSRRKFDGTV
jgi:predicted acylesterase/phospholipase RssA/CRP-like cAMP-binding protein